MVTIRPEEQSDWPAIDSLLRQAFEGPAEATLVETLRSRGRLSLALVATQEAQVVGYIAFSPISIEGDHPQGLHAVGLAPLAVLPSHHRQGIGSRLMEAGLEDCGRKGWDLIFVLGEPDYYGRFGFVTTARHGLRWEMDCPEAYFMVHERREGSLANSAGIVRYDKAFALV